jgi:hypothetical protein
LERPLRFAKTPRPKSGGRFSRSRLEAGPAASLALHFGVAELDEAFAFAILALDLLGAGILLHVLSDSRAFAAPRDEARFISSMKAHTDKPCRRFSFYAVRPP